MSAGALGMITLTLGMTPTIILAIGEGATGAILVTMEDTMVATMTPTITTQVTTMGTMVGTITATTEGTMTITLPTTMAMLLELPLVPTTNIITTTPTLMGHVRTQVGQATAAPGVGTLLTLK